MNKTRLFTALLLIVSLSAVHPAPGDGERFFRIAKESYEERNFRKAYENFFRAAAENHLEGTYYTAYCLENAIGIERSYEKAAQFYQKAVKSGHTESILRLGGLYSSGRGVEQDYYKALDCYKTVLEQIRGEKGEYDDGVAKMYDTVAEVYVGLEDYTTALEYFQRSLAIIKKLHGANDEKAYDSYKNIGIVYLKSRDYENSYLYLQKALSLLETLSNASIEEKAFIFDTAGQMFEARKNFKEAHEHYENAKTFYVASATVLPSNSRKNSPLPFDDEPDASYVEVQLDSLDVAKEFVNIARLYYFEETDESLEKALLNAKTGLEMIQKISKTPTPQEAYACTLIGRIYDKMNYFPQALEFYKKAKDLNKSVYGDKHSEVALSYNNMAVIYWQAMKDYRNAKNCITEMLNIYDEYLSPVAYGDFSEILENLWDLFINWQPVQANKKLSEEFAELRLRTFRLALSTTEKIRNASLPPAHREAIMVKVLPFYYLAVGFYSHTGQNEMALRYADLIKTEGFIEAIGELSLLNIPELTEKDRAEISRCMTEIQQYTVNIFTQTAKPKNEVDYYSVRTMNMKMIEAKRNLAAVEKNLRKYAPRYFMHKEIEPLRAADVFRWCGSEKIALEYVLWNKSYEKQLVQNEKYAVRRLSLEDHVLRAYQHAVKNARAEAEQKSKKSKTDVRPILPEPPARKTIDSWCIVAGGGQIHTVKVAENFDYDNEITELRNLLIRREDPETGNFLKYRKYLYSKLIEPVESFLPYGSDLLIVPDRTLTYLPFDLLGDGEIPDLGERFNISMSAALALTVRNSERSDFTNSSYAKTGGSSVNKNPATQDAGHNAGYNAGQDAEPNTEWKVLGVGNVLYDRFKKGNNRGIFSHARTSGSPDDLQKFSRLANPRTAGEYFKEIGISWNNLPGTRYEIQQLKNKIFKTDVSLIEGINASEQTLKWLSAERRLREYSIVHFACHSYFDNAYPPMTSLAFSDSSDANSQSPEDGYLTLCEIASLDMNADFTMISASQTHSDRAASGKPISGLAQSFFLAGSKKVGVALWNVDDETTCIFFEKLYQKIQGADFASGEMSWAKAFRDAKEDLKKERNWITPYYWSSFVLYE